jgi:signal transduction histidine kinase
MGIDYPIKQLGWACFANVSVSEVLSKHLNDTKRDIFVLLIVVIGSFIMAAVFGTRIINPINRLKEAAEEISKGNLQVRTNFSGDDELAATSQAFDRMTEDINQLIFETEEYNRLKSRFFATISHELKTPLNIVLASVQLIEKLDISDSDSYQDSMKKYLKMLKQNSLRLLRLINNLIDINKIEGNHMIIQLVNCDIVEVVEDITLSIVEYTKSKDIELIFDTEIEEKIMAFDPEKIERIMLNLLSNAIKFTDSGGKIEVNIYDREAKLLISVKDTGIGIPEDMHEKIFDYFTRVDSSLQRKTEGSGIGLSLVKSLVELHEGSITVKSQCGTGSEFIVELPVKLLNKDENHYEEISLSNKERINVEFSDIYL